MIIYYQLILRLDNNEHFTIFNTYIEPFFFFFFKNCQDTYSNNTLLLIIVKKIARGFSFSNSITAISILKIFVFGFMTQKHVTCDTMDPGFWLAEVRHVHGMTTVASNKITTIIILGIILWVNATDNYY